MGPLSPPTFVTCPITRLKSQKSPKMSVAHEIYSSSKEHLEFSSCLKQIPDEQVGECILRLWDNDMENIHWHQAEFVDTDPLLRIMNSMLQLRELKKGVNNLFDSEKV